MIMLFVGFGVIAVENKKNMDKIEEQMNSSSEREMVCLLPF